MCGRRSQRPKMCTPAHPIRRQSPSACPTLPQTKREMPDGKCELVLRTVEAANGVPEHKVPVTRRVHDILREVLLVTRTLLRMVPSRRVVIREWQDCAMDLQCLMVTSRRTLRRYALPFFVRHPTAHYALVHGVDTIREQNWQGDATEGVFLCMEGGEHTHQHDMKLVATHTRHSARLRSHDILYCAKLARGLSFRYGYLPPPAHPTPSFHI